MYGSSAMIRRMKFNQRLKKRLPIPVHAILDNMIVPMTLASMFEGVSVTQSCFLSPGRMEPDVYPKGEMFFDMQLGQSLETGKSVLKVACPYCMPGFDGKVLTIGNKQLH
jgi:hypothetical protein